MKFPGGSWMITKEMTEMMSSDGIMMSNRLPI
jgi:hypothetical protein